MSDSVKDLGPGVVRSEGTSMLRGNYLHASGIVLRLGHPDVESSLLISSSGGCNCSIGLLVGAVDGQLIKRHLNPGSREE